MSETNNQNSPYTYGTGPSQPNYNAPTPNFLQNAQPQPLPAYSATPSTQVWTVPTVAPQWRMAGVVAPNTNSESSFHPTFLKGKPRALGIVLIISAMLEIILGIVLIYTSATVTLPSGISFWGSLFYIITGSLTIAAQPKPNICLVKGSLSLNIISALFSFTAAILNILDLAINQCYYADYYYYDECMSILGSKYAVIAVLLLLNLLVFCVSLSISIFGCCSLSAESSTNPQVFVIQNDPVFAMNPSAVPVASSGFAQPYPPATAPPPYVSQQFKAFPAS